MVFGSLVAISVLAFFLLSFFDKELRDQAIEKSSDIVRTLLRSTPVIADKVIVDPVNNLKEKFLTGRSIGGIEIDQTKEGE